MKSIIITLCHLLYLPLAASEITTIEGSNFEDVYLYKDTRPGMEYIANTNYRNHIRCPATAWTHSGSPTYFRTLLKFDLSSIPANAKIINATLHFYSDPNITSPNASNGNSTLSGSNAFFLEKVSENWNPSTVTWNNQPNTDPTLRVWIDQSASPTENIQIDIISLIQYWIENPDQNYGAKMLLENEIYYRSRTYASTDHTHESIRPKLIIEYSEILSAVEESDYVIENLDKSEITTDILYDRVVPIANLKAFDGSSNTDTSYSEHFSQAYYEIFSSNYNQSTMIEPATINNNINNNYSRNFIPFGIIDYKINIFDSMALDNNLIYINNGQAYDVQGRSTSPYDEINTLVASPLLPDKINHVYTNSSLSFKLDNNFVFSNTGSTLEYIDVNFDDGVGIRRMLPNETTSVNYLTSGRKLIRFYLKFSDRTVLNAISYINAVTTTINSCDGSVSFRVDGYDFDVSQYDASKGNESASGTAYIYFADENCNDQKIRKPIVFLDGFDPSPHDSDASRNHTEIYDDYINYSEDPTIKLGDDMRSEGYDLIIFDYDNGADFIEKNGLAVIKLLEELYARYSSDLQDYFVVIGPSMGALIGQYALAEAERRGIDHHTKLFISFDGPHQGAHVPIGIQQLYDYFINRSLIGSIAEGLTDIGILKSDFYLLDKPGVKQMLVHHYTKGELPESHQYRNIFKTNMEILGYPNNCRNIAVINGSRNASNQPNIIPGEQFGSINSWIKYFWIFKKKIMNIKIMASPDINRSKTLEANVNSNILNFFGLASNYEAYGLPAENGPFSSVSLDVIAGGTNSVNTSYYDNIIGLISGGIWVDILPANFICSTSAADLQHPDGFRYVYDFSTINLACEGYTPFDAVYAPDINQEHVAISTENAIWFENEIKGNPQLQPLSTSAYISGPSFICSSSSSSLFELKNPPAGTINWSSEPFTALNPSSDNNTNLFYTLDNNDYLGNVVIKAKILQSCGYSEVSKTVRMNGPFDNEVTIYPEYACPGEYGYIDVSINSPGNYSNYQWIVNSEIDIISGHGTEELYVFYDYIFSGGYAVVFFENQCGEDLGDYSSQIYEDYYCSSLYTYNVSPNPTSEYLNISFVDDNSINENMISNQQVNDEELDYQVLIYSHEKVLLINETGKEKFKQIDVSNLIPGNYILNVVIKGKIYKNHIIIN